MYSVEERTSAFAILKNEQETGLFVLCNFEASRAARGASVQELSRLEADERRRCLTLAEETASALNREPLLPEAA